MAQYRKDNREKFTADERRRYRLATYGLTQAGYEALFVEQGGCCAICRQPLLSTKTTHVDHDHDHPGTHRGLLCQSCNLGIGQLQDSAELLAVARDYILHWGQVGSQEP